MAFFKKSVPSTDIPKLQQKRAYIKLAKMLRHEDPSVAAMAEDALGQLVVNDEEKKKRLDLYKINPKMYDWIFDRLIKKLEAAQSSNPNLKSVPLLVCELREETAPLKMEKDAEQKEIEALHALLKEKGVGMAHTKNVRDLKALLEPGEVIECALGEGQRGQLMACFDYSLYTNKNFYILRGLANHKDWGSITKISYTAVHDIKERGLILKKYQVSGAHAEKFSFTVDKDHVLLKQLARYGSAEVMGMMAKLGFLGKEPIG